MCITVTYSKYRILSVGVGINCSVIKVKSIRSQSNREVWICITLLSKESYV